MKESAALIARRAGSGQDEARLGDALPTLGDGSSATPDRIKRNRPQPDGPQEQENALNQQRDVERLTALAESQIASSYDGELAYGKPIDTLRRILELDADNAKAQQRLHHLAERLKQDARDKQRAGQFERSLTLVGVGLRAEPNHAELRVLKEEVTRQLTEERVRQRKENEVNELLERAERQLKAFQLTRPKGDNAYESYLTALENAPRDERALAGMRRIADRYAVLARSRKERGDLPASQDLITRGLGIVADHSGLLELDAQVSAKIEAEPGGSAHAQR